MCRAGPWSGTISYCYHDHLRATRLVPDLLRVSAFLPRLPTDLPPPQALLPSPYPALLPSQGRPSPQHHRLSGQYPWPRTPSREDRTVSSVRAVSPGWAHKRCSACVWGWTHLDTKNDEHVTHSLTRAPERSLTGILSSPATRRHPQLQGGLNREHLAGRERLLWALTEAPVPSPPLSPQDQAHSRLRLSTCMAVSTPPPPQYCTHGLPGNCKK